MRWGMVPRRCLGRVASSQPGGDSHALPGAPFFCPLCWGPVSPKRRAPRFRRARWPVVAPHRLAPRHRPFKAGGTGSNSPFGGQTLSRPLPTQPNSSIVRVEARPLQWPPPTLSKVWEGFRGVQIPSDRSSPGTAPQPGARQVAHLVMSVPLKGEVGGFRNPAPPLTTFSSPAKRPVLMNHGSGVLNDKR